MPPTFADAGLVLEVGVGSVLTAAVVLGVALIVAAGIMAGALMKVSRALTEVRTDVAQVSKDLAVLSAISVR